MSHSPNKIVIFRKAAWTLRPSSLHPLWHFDPIRTSIVKFCPCDTMTSWVCLTQSKCPSIFCQAYGVWINYHLLLNVHLFYLEYDRWSFVTFCLMVFNSFNVDILSQFLFTICFVTLCQFLPDVIRSVTFCQVVTFDLLAEIAVYTSTVRTFWLLEIRYFSLLHLPLLPGLVTLCLFGFDVKFCQVVTYVFAWKFSSIYVWMVFCDELCIVLVNFCDILSFCYSTQIQKYQYHFTPLFWAKTFSVITGGKDFIWFISTQSLCIM
jgi:hypothetical protein